jgi:hypothetical protein
MRPTQKKAAALLFENRRRQKTEEADYETRNTNGKDSRQCHDRNLNDPACKGKTKT